MHCHRSVFIVNATTHYTIHYCLSNTQSQTKTDLLQGTTAIHPYCHVPALHIITIHHRPLQYTWKHLPCTWYMHLRGSTHTQKREEAISFHMHCYRSRFGINAQPITKYISASIAQSSTRFYCYACSLSWTCSLHIITSQHRPLQYAWKHLCCTWYMQPRGSWLRMDRVEINLNLESKHQSRKIKIHKMPQILYIIKQF